MGRRYFVFVREVRNWQTAVYQLKRGTYPGGFGDVTFEALDHHASPPADTKPAGQLCLLQRRRFEDDDGDGPGAAIVMG